MSGFNALMWVCAVGVAGFIAVVLLAMLVGALDERRAGQLRRKLAFLGSKTTCEGGVWVTRFDRQSWHALWYEDIDYAMAKNDADKPSEAGGGR